MVSILACGVAEAASRWDAPAMPAQGHPRRPERAVRGFPRAADREDDRDRDAEEIEARARLEDLAAETDDDLDEDERGEEGLRRYGRDVRRERPEPLDEPRRRSVADDDRDRLGATDRRAAPRRSPPPPPPTRRPRGAPVEGFQRRLVVTTGEVLTAPLSFDRHERGAAAAMVAIPVAMIVTGSDDDLFRLLSENRSPSRTNFTDFADQLGEIPVSAGILAAIGGYGYLFDDTRAVATMETGVLSTMIAGAIITTAKFVTGRARPNANKGSRSFEPFGGDMSFPSGHTTVAFCLAGSISYHYPGWIGRAALIAASGTAYARIYKFNHWPSDVVAASLLSTGIAYLTARVNAESRFGQVRIISTDHMPGAGLQLGF